MKAYTQAATSGRYDTNNGLLGKYDNVRTYWEEEALRQALQPCLEDRAAIRRKAGTGLRILDIGCGSGDGLALLESIALDSDDLTRPDTALLSNYPLQAYRGIDLNDELLAQAADRYGGMNAARFDKVDLSTGIPFDKDESAYDLYFASFGTFSHLDTEQTVRVLADVARHADTGSLVLIDWLGRYSYEWQNLWNADTSRDVWMDYRISYIYSAEERKTRDIASFPLRLVSREEVETMFTSATEQAGVPMELITLCDRSVFSGRHIDTGEYNDNAMPIREHLNSLYDHTHRTNLSKLRVTYRPCNGFDRQNGFFSELADAWNGLLDYTAILCETVSASGALPEPSSSGPAPLTRGMHRMAQVTASAGHFHGEDKRAMLIEPQLGYALRDLEQALQPGLGCGHGLLAVARVGIPQ